MSTAIVIPFAPDSRDSATMMDRYRAAYQVAEKAAAFAETVKLVGIFLAGLLFVSAIMVFQINPDERAGFPVVSASLVAVAVLIILASHLWAMVFRIQGQMLQITIDSAVHSSPSLSNAQRATVISWAKEELESGQLRAA